MPIAFLLPAIQLLHPMPGVITQGVRPGHPAIDIACAPGTPVRAAHAGISSVQRSYTHGITVVVVGSDGLETSYSHLQQATARGQVERGDAIGLCGNTGIWSSGPHLHFESNRPELLSNLLREQPAPAAAATLGAIGGTAAAFSAPPR